MSTQPFGDVCSYRGYPNQKLNHIQFNLIPSPPCLSLQGFPLVQGDLLHQSLRVVPVNLVVQDIPPSQAFPGNQRYLVVLHLLQDLWCWIKKIISQPFPLSKSKTNVSIGYLGVLQFPEGIYTSSSQEGRVLDYLGQSTPALGRAMPRDRPLVLAVLMLN